MDNTIPAVRPDVLALETSPRSTAAPVRVQFSEVLSGGARALVQGAQAAMRALPGGPVVVAAVRGGGLGPAATRAANGLGSSGAAPEGPSAMGAGALGAGAAMLPLTGGSSTAVAGDGSVESSLAQSQQMNLYYLQVQEQVNSENRTFTLLSNVLEIEHNTAKSAIGNIH
jgi:hypothetical protein